jgi:hypothetical protein
MSHRTSFALALLLTISDGTTITAAAEAVPITGTIVDADTQRPVAARMYVVAEDGTHHFAESADPAGQAIRYDKQNWINARSIERHTTLSAHPFRLELPPGTYTLTVERGKEYFTETRVLTVIAGQPQTLSIPLRRWFNAAIHGWYSGETHLHRPLDELPTVLLAEDLNVAFPLSYWVTKAYAPPTQGDKNLGGEIPAALLRADDTHVFWPRNTEYEIFSVGDRRHTLGALFVLNHQSVFTTGVPPVGPVIQQARAEGAFFDIDKHDWPWAMLLPAAARSDLLFELSNNHVWRTEFAFRQFNARASAYLFSPAGGNTGDERDWLHFTWNTYYTLLNSGLRLNPTAGTASGVHPVPVGFSRVYVHLPKGFSYGDWVDGLRAGRSFVTTGPMLLAVLNSQRPGHTFTTDGEPFQESVWGEIFSEHPLAMAEVIVNGETVRTIMPRNQPREGGEYLTEFSVPLTLRESGWVVVRCLEDRPDGRVRFAHTAPWWVDVPGKPHRPRREEVDYLVRRMDEEIARSRGVLSPEALVEYERAREQFAGIEPRPDDVSEVRKPTDDADLRRWLESMIWHHGYTLEEQQAVTGLPPEQLREAAQRFDITADNRPSRGPAAPLLVQPFPGGRHPRTGFRDGAIKPQRDTKISVFPPWKDGGYAVVDVPEAIFSNLGLTYLAHTHVPTIWSQQNVSLPQLEWTQDAEGRLTFTRALSNGITFGAEVIPTRDDVQMELWLKNGTPDKLTGLRVQVCTMLNALAGFRAQTRTNKVLQPPYAACRSEDGQRWIITAWTPTNRAWANPPVPCLHSDPQFPDCEPGQTVRVHGRVWFAEGADLDRHLSRLEATNWR